MRIYVGSWNEWSLDPRLPIEGGLPYAERPVIDYYFAPMSGYAYLGHVRFTAPAETARAMVRYHPLDMAQVFAAAGSPHKYPEVRQLDRKADMGR